jgi:dihydrofolate synthase/folylpolyglutamate synthase
MSSTLHNLNCLIHELQSQPARYSPDASLLILKHINPAASLPTHILVGGTNGKGSVTQLLSSIYKAGGYKAGTFISPHLLNYRERIAINGNPVSDKTLLTTLREKVAPIRTWLFEKHQTPLTFFESMLLAAIFIFIDEKCDTAVFEAGLGGKRDASIILNPSLSIITNVSLDHTHILGCTLEEIAREKSGCIRENALTLYAGDNSLTPIFTSEAKEKNARLYTKDDTFHISGKSTLDGTTGTIYTSPSPIEFQCPLRGDYQLENIQIAVSSVMLLNRQIPLNTEHISQGLSHAIHTCRLELLSTKPTLLVDGSHNEAGFKELFRWLDSNNLSHRTFLALCIKDNKNHEAIQRLLKYKKLYLYRPPEKKYLAEKKALSLYPDGHWMPSFKSIYEDFLKNKSKDDLLLFSGSLPAAARQKRNFRTHRKNAPFCEFS